MAAVPLNEEYAIEKRGDSVAIFAYHVVEGEIRPLPHGGHVVLDFPAQCSLWAKINKILNEAFDLGVSKDYEDKPENYKMSRWEQLEMPFKEALY